MDKEWKSEMLNNESGNYEKTVVKYQHNGKKRDEYYIRGN